ncbi:hypothetical protein A9Q98_10960 [Thalassotalea sp. 42_200_T64]|nr:hypothetical protein A9Q98_10960 [Thalassotalea sp. 42_200_T64]
MKPKHLALAIFIIGLATPNLVYVISAVNDWVPSCVPYLEGCTSISRAARRGYSIFIFRALMIVHATMLICYWYVCAHWLQTLHKRGLTSINWMMWLGITGALFLALYANYLGASGEVYRYLRRYGIVLFFGLTPLAQLLMINSLYKLSQHCGVAASFRFWLRIKLGLLSLMLMIAIGSLLQQYLGYSSFERENIVEWNIGLLLMCFYYASYRIWHNYTMEFVVTNE